MTVVTLDDTVIAPERAHALARRILILLSLSQTPARPGMMALKYERTVTYRPRLHRQVALVDKL